MKLLTIIILACAQLAFGSAPCGSTASVALAGIQYSNPDYPFTDSLNGVFIVRRYGNYDHSGYCHYSFASQPNEYGVYLFLSVLIYGTEISVQETLIRNGVPLQAQVFIGDSELQPLQNEITQNGGTAVVVQ